MRGEDERQYIEYVSARLPGLHRTAYVLCGDPHRADDIVQATLTDLYRKWHRATSADNIDAYVHRMLVRKHLDEQRRGWSRVWPLVEAPERAESPPTGVEDRDALRGVLGQLSHAQRTVLVMRFVCDMSVEDVASALRCSTSNVKSHTARGLATVRRLIGVTPGTGGDDEYR